VPAHIASYYTAFCAEFIGGLQKPYFIDPMTYVFAQDPAILKRALRDKKGKIIRDALKQKIKGNTKRSYLKLIERAYKGIVEQVVNQNRRMNPSDLGDAAVADELVQNVVAFQRSSLSSLPAKYKKYAKYAVGRTLPTENLPMLIVPPYFYTANASWHRVNLDLAARAKALVSDLPVFGMIFCSTQTIEASGEQIVKDFGKIGLDGFILWVNDFSGMQGFKQLRLVRDCVSSLANFQRPVISMYSDAFSLVLAYVGLTAYCCGICYAERKAADQDSEMEGALPVRYYVKQLKKKVQIETEARRIPLRDYGLTCECEICKRTVDPVLLDDSKAREHFMLIRQQEIESIRGGQSSAEFSQMLRDAYEHYVEEPLLSPVTHLANWSKLLT